MGFLANPVLGSIRHTHWTHSQICILDYLYGVSPPSPPWIRHCISLWALIPSNKILTRRRQLYRQPRPNSRMQCIYVCVEYVQCYKLQMEDKIIDCIITSIILKIFYGQKSDLSSVTYCFCKYISGNGGFSCKYSQCTLKTTRQVLCKIFATDT